MWIDKWNLLMAPADEGAPGGEEVVIETPNTTPVDGPGSGRSALRIKP